MNRNYNYLLLIKKKTNKLVLVVLFEAPALPVLRNVLSRPTESSLYCGQFHLRGLQTGTQRVKTEMGCWHLPGLVCPFSSIRRLAQSLESLSRGSGQSQGVGFI